MAAVLSAPQAGAAQPSAPEAPALQAPALQAPALEARLAGELPDLPRGVAPQTLRDFYAARGHAPLWLNAGVPRAQTLLDRLEAAGREGLRPVDYRPAALRADLPGLSDPAARAGLELRLSAQFLHYARDLSQGRVRPGAVDADAPAPAQAPNAGGLLAALAAADDPAALLDARAPANPVYRRLRRALADYRALAEAGGWPRVEAGRTLEQGMAGPDVAALRARLRASRDLTIDSDTPDQFDDQLALAVRRFQDRHGLEADGIVGPKTRAALNVPVDSRIAQIEVNMERWRWMPDDLGERYLLVNLAGQEVELVESGSVRLSMRAVVGKPFRKTPVFSDEITYLEFNPDWTLPPTILREDVLPELRRDPGYLAANDMSLYAGWAAGADRLDPTTIDWAEVTPKRFPYKIVQEPGPKNPLGRVKFMFPNAHHVYLHDSPAKNLFTRASRAFSSGCIRVAKPFELAHALLGGTPVTDKLRKPLGLPPAPTTKAADAAADSPVWDRALIDRLLDHGETTPVRLPEPVPVHLTYSTVWIGEGGTVHFRPDIYGRDRALAEALASRPVP
ncbi:MAG: L,D-transpeptidase family protein [Rhodovibrio sp.]|nr:L,D-transpeptidase family protein [Rhodovibrio sp.]